MINILHLYYDILNLYGENGNIRALDYNLKNSNIKVKVDYKSIKDKINLDKYDIIYIGSGDEENLLIALKHLKTISKDMKKYINSNKYLFLTGNAMYMFGKYIDTLEEKIEGANVFDYNVKYIKENKYKNASNYRISCETTSSYSLINELVIGFQNRCGLIYDVKKPLFKTSIKNSNDLVNDNEGFTYKNVYATQNIGPFFIRNPYLLDYFLTKICKDKKLKYIINDNSNEKIAYKKYLNI